MREIGGYIELEKYNLPMWHESAIALNCGRNCLAYIIQARKIKKIALPYFLCDSVSNVCKKYEVQIRYYSIDETFIPYDFSLDEDEWLYLVNYYGQLSNDYFEEMCRKYERIIVDQAQAYFQMPVKGVDMLYTCRKFFGVPDGAFLYTDAILDEKLEQDESFERMHFLLGRYEKTASEFYNEYVENNKMFANEEIKRMSKLTTNLLHAINYENVKQKRTENFNYLFTNLDKYNLLQLRNVQGAFAYPLMVENAVHIRKKLLEKKIYIPTLWPNVLKDVLPSEIEYKMAQNILPLPCDQRYDTSDMEMIVKYLYEEM